MLSSICFMPASLRPQSLPPFAEHRLIFRRQHRRDVHARRVVPDEERLVGLLGIVAVEEVDDMGRDFLVDGPRAVERQRALVLAGLVLRRAVARTCMRSPAAAASGRCRPRDRPRLAGPERPGTGVFLQGGTIACIGRALVDVGEADALHRVEVIEIAPEFLEAVRRRQSVGVVAEMILAELAGVVAEIVAGTSRAPACRAANRMGCRAVAAGSCPSAADACR